VLEGHCSFVRSGRLTMRHWATFILLLAAFVTGSQSQTAARARSIAGVVLDPSGAAIVGAQVTFSRNGVLSPQTTTDALGNFHFDNLSSGDYLLDVQHEGFRETTKILSLGTRSSSFVRIVLPISVRDEQIDVEADTSAPRVSTEIAQNQNANTVDRAALDRVPVFDQDYVTTLSRFLDDSAIGTNGVSLVVNGVEANGPGVTASAVKEVKINQNPYSALFSRPGRARLEITTKGGTPEVHGSMNFMFRDSLFDASNPFATVKPSEQRHYYEGSLTGPLGKSKKTTFLLSLDRDEDDQEAIVVAAGVRGSINENVPNPTRHFFGSGRVFRDLGKGDLFWIGYSYERKTVMNQGVGGTVLPEAGTNLKFQEHEINVSYLHVFSQKWLNQLRFLVGHFDTPTTGQNSNAQIVVSGAFTGGGAQADSRRTEYHFDGTDIVSYVTGKHELRFGIDVPDISRRGMDDFTNTEGTYTFGSLAAYEAGQPSTYLVQRGQGHLVFVEKTLSGFVEDNIRLKPNLSISFGMRYYWQNYFHDDPNNFAPRLGFAYAPSTKSKTVIRGGAGVFYDRTGPRPIADLLHFNGVNLLRFIIDNPTYPVAPSSLVGVPTSVVVLAPKARIPYTVQYGIGIEQQVTQKSTFSATYVGSRGIDLFRSIDANAPLPPARLNRPNPNSGQEREIQSEGYQKSNALELTYRGRPSKFLNGQVQYTLSKTYNNSSGITYFPADSYDPAADWARSDNDRRHKFDLLGSIQPTKFFTLGLALSLYSGKPVDVTTGSDNNRDGVINDRPPGLPRNTLHGPGLVNLDLNVAHDFVLSKAHKEARTLTVSLNSFNVLNHRNDVTYVGVVTSPFFGRAVEAKPPRRMQLDVQFKF
jgi:carboxypeptidase family protein